jgi:hypothetical protein
VPEQALRRLPIPARAGLSRLLTDALVSKPVSIRPRRLPVPQPRLSPSGEAEALDPPSRSTSMPERFEYKVVEVRESLVGGKLSGAKLEKLLNEHASQGWQLKASPART